MHVRVCFLATSVLTTFSTLVLTTAQLLELYRFQADGNKDSCDRAFVAYITTAVYSGANTRICKESSV